MKISKTRRDYAKKSNIQKQIFNNFHFFPSFEVKFFYIKIFTGKDVISFKNLASLASD